MWGRRWRRAWRDRTLSLCRRRRRRHHLPVLSAPLPSPRRQHGPRCAGPPSSPCHSAVVGMQGCFFLERPVVCFTRFLLVWTSTRKMLLSLFLVSPILEFGVQCWSPHLARDIEALERIQQRATKFIPDPHALPYDERSRCLGLQTLQEREGTYC